MQSTNWLFTINNPTEEDNPNNWQGCVYRVWQLEKGSEGTPHLQGYVVLESRRVLSYLKKMNAKAHWEIRKGSHIQAKTYCTKEETRIDGPWELGKEPQQGCRNDLAGAVELVLRKRPFSEVEPQVLVKYHKGLAALAAAHAEKRTWKPLVVSLTGPTGCGKTRMCFDRYPDLYKKDKTKWWDGYVGQPVVLLDEFYGSIPLGEMLEILDRYPHQVETKGGYTHLAARVILITSNTRAVDWYKISYDWKPQLFRRIDRFYEFIEGVTGWVQVPDMLHNPGDFVSCKLPPVIE